MGLASLTILTGNAIAQAQYAELLKVRGAARKAWFANDQATREKILPREVIAINDGQQKWEHRTEILGSAKQFATRRAKLIRLCFPRVETQSFGEVATFYIAWETEAEIQGKHVINSGRTTEVLICRSGRWLNAR